MSVKVDIINDKTDELWTTVELEDDVVEIIELLDLTIEDAVINAFKMLESDYKQDPEAFKKKYTELAKKYNIPVADGVS